MKHTSILMVCLGNICRSPLAEGILRSKLDFTKFKVDSAGTSANHSGESPDQRSIDVAKLNGLDITGQSSRKFTKQDFTDFDIIYVMDRANYRDVTRLAATDEEKKKVIKILDELFPNEDLDVPDPYYGGTSGFDNVYKMLDSVTDKIAKRLNDIEP